MGGDLTGSVTVALDIGTIYVQGDITRTATIEATNGNIGSIIATGSIGAVGLPHDHTITAGGTIGLVQAYGAGGIWSNITATGAATWGVGQVLAYMGDVNGQINATNGGVYYVYSAVSYTHLRAHET